MIYPKKLSSKKGDLIFKIFLISSVILGILLFIINKLTTPNIPWATLTNAGIIYIWITVFYSINKNTNIAGHVLIQAIAISLLTVFIDYKLGFEKWSINISIPIIIIIANVTMLVLTIVSYKKYSSLKNILFNNFLILSNLVSFLITNPVSIIPPLEIFFIHIYTFYFIYETSLL